MDGLECSEIPFSQIDLGDRYDAEYFAKKYLYTSEETDDGSLLYKHYRRL